MAVTNSPANYGHSLWKEVLGHQLNKNLIWDSFEKNQMAQTQLWSGPEGIGKKSLAIALVQRILCEKNLSKVNVEKRTGQPIGEACGICGSCVQVEKGTHPGMMLVVPEGQMIKVEQAEAVTHFLHLRSIVSHRFIILDQADRFNVAGANSLLKSIEEPPDGTYFILITSNRAAMLSTLLSRSRKITFGLLSVEELTKKFPQAVAMAARGSFHKAQELSDPEFLEQRKKAIDVLKLFWTDEDFLLNDFWRGEFKDRSNALDLVRIWLGLISETLVGGLKTSLSSIPVSRILWLGTELLQLERNLLGNHDSQLLMEDLFIRKQKEVHVLD